MKKALSLLLITGIWGYFQGQNTSSAKKPAACRSISIEQLMKIRFQQGRETANAPKNSEAAGIQKKRPHKIGSEPNLPHLGSSFNPNSVLDASTTAVTANQACGLIVMTHRDDSSKYRMCNDGAYEAAFSVDGGAVWDTNIYIGCNVGTRFPNGVIFNGAGNTNPANCTDVMAGSYVNSASTSFLGTAYGSTTLSGEGGNSHEQLWPNGTPGIYTQDYDGQLEFMSSSNDSTVHVIGDGWTQNSTNYVTWLGAVLTTGKFNAAADSFQWKQTLFRPHIVPGIQGFATMSLPYDSMAGLLGVSGTAWSQDGKTGYVLMFGNLDSVGYNYTSYQPIVYKTTNSGSTWVMMPPYNFANISSFAQHLIPTIDSGYATPLWYLYYTGSGGATNNYDVTVDANGNLHIMGAVVAAYYTNPDSAYKITTYLGGSYGYIYDVYTTTNTGGWQARFIDSMNTYPCNVEASYTNDWQSDANGSVAFGNRLQASRTTDGRKVFCTWLDDVSGIEFDSLVAPDVFGQAYDVVKNKASLVYEFTNNTENNYFLCVSDIALTSGSPDTTYTIPCTIAYPQSPPGDGGAITGCPINYFYLGSVEYNDSLVQTNGSKFSDIPAITAPGFSISPNYPNPFSDITYFKINLTQESVVKVDVYNLLGEEIYSIGSQKMSSGSHLMTINGKGWSSGVYFYKVTANDRTLTQKMVVQ